MNRLQREDEDFTSASKASAGEREENAGRKRGRIAGLLPRETNGAVVLGEKDSLKGDDGPRPLL